MNLTLYEHSNLELFLISELLFFLVNNAAMQKKQPPENLLIFQGVEYIKESLLSPFLPLSKL